MFEEANACLLNCQPCAPEPGGPNPRALITLTSLLPLTTAQNPAPFGTSAGSPSRQLLPVRNATLSSTLELWGCASGLKEATRFLKLLLCPLQPEHLYTTTPQDFLFLRIAQA